MKRNKVILVIVGIVLASQLYRPARTNPTVQPQNELSSHTQMPAEVSQILNRSCSDCHSNKTTWPWYSKVAPVSWVVADDVVEGRRHMNLSEWGSYPLKRQLKKIEDICDEVKDGGMPLKSYTWIHKGTALSQPERDTVCKWSQAEHSRLAATQSQAAATDGK